jgi:hypothetical protein
VQALLKPPAPVTGLLHGSASTVSLLVVDARLGRRDIAIVSIIVAYHRRRTGVLQASNGFDQLDLQNSHHDPSPRNGLDNASIAR